MSSESCAFSVDTILWKMLSTTSFSGALPVLTGTVAALMVGDTLCGISEKMPLLSGEEQDESQNGAEVEAEEEGEAEWE